MNTIHTGDAFDVLPTLEGESVHAVVTDPPYGLAFMGRDWDDFEPKEYQEWCERWAGAVKRVLKPGGHLLAFSGNRTHHRLFSGVEDAGFEVRDTLTWHYGSGFPKALDVSKAIDKAAGAADQRETVGKQRGNGIEPGHGNYVENDAADWNDDGFDVTEPATDAAEAWVGWKTGLKPATEFIVLARKPFEGTVAECVQEHGTSALNVDGCRIETDGRPRIGIDPNAGTGSLYEGGHEQTSGMAEGETTESRYPANVIFDASVAGALDREVGELDAGAHTPQGAEGAAVNFYGDRRYRDDPDERIETDSGGPSRYFYTSKATKAERTLDGKIDNAHPTVKPGDLMEWLVRLATAKGQTVLDPFCGTGTTCRAAKDLGRAFIGIERQAQWADVARVRCGLTPDDPANVRADDAQAGIEAFAND